MPVLNDADSLFLGDAAVDAVHLGAIQVWPPSPAPTATLLNPVTAQANERVRVMAVVGSGFRAGSRIVFDGVEILDTHFQTADYIFAPNVTMPSTPKDTTTFVRNPDGQVSNSLPFSVTGGAPPSISILDPNIASYLVYPGARGCHVYIYGTGFVGTPEVLVTAGSVSDVWNPAGYYLGLYFDLPDVVGEVMFTVRNPDGQTSNSLPFMVTDDPISISNRPVTEIPEPRTDL